MEKLSPMNAMTNGISTNAGPTVLRSSAMQPYIAGNRNAATMQTATSVNGMACFRAVGADGEEKQTHKIEKCSCRVRRDGEDDGKRYFSIPWKSAQGRERRVENGQAV